MGPNAVGSGVGAAEVTGNTQRAAAGGVEAAVVGPLGTAATASHLTEPELQLPFPQ